jgi:cobalt-zinc-cadmium resistance protein CzcA
MLSRIVDLALRQRLVVLLAALGLAAWGTAAYVALPIDARRCWSPCARPA